MLRAKPSVIQLTAGEVKDAETRLRFRRHLRRADAQQHLELRGGIEQNRESSPLPKDGSIPATTRGSDRVLANSPPQSPPVPGRWPTSVSGSPDSPERYASNDQEATGHRSQDSARPRPLAMSPRRFPHALSAESFQHREAHRGRPGGFTTVLPPSAFAYRTRRETPAGLDRDADPVRPNEDEFATSPARESTSPPTLPPPFSQTRRVISGEYRVPKYVEVADSDSDDEHAEASGTGRLPPATPARRSSLSATARRQAVSDTQEEASITNVFERDEADTPHTRSRRLQSTRRNAPRTPASSTHDDQDEGTPSSPSARSTRLQIYNDSLPASAQPETPQNLPEARHQSRLRGSYTVPARRDSPLEILTPTTSRRWREEARRNPTPAGLQTPGFLGLYGGIENSDEVALFQEAERAVGGRASRVVHSSSFDL